MTKLTKRQSEILALIQNHLNEKGSPPTRAEIAKTMGFKSPNAAEDHLRALSRKGVIELLPGTSRGIRLKEAMGIPVYSLSRTTKTQGSPLDNKIGLAKIDRHLFKPNIDYLILLHNNIDAIGFLKGDALAIHETSAASLGQLVLLKSNQEPVILRLTEEVKKQNYTIEGIVVGLLRGFTQPLFHE